MPNHRPPSPIAPSILVRLFTGALVCASALAAQEVPELHARHRGSGTYVIRGSSDSWKLSEARVEIRPGHRVVIEIRGRGLDLRMSGEATGWAAHRQIAIALERFDGEPTNAKGWVRLDQRGGFERIELDGNTPKRLGISFFSDGPNLESPPPSRPPVPSPAPTVRVTEEHGTDRRGSDFTDFRVRDLGECQSACRNDHRCLAYSFDRRESRCWLKNGTPAASSERNHVSGVKVSENQNVVDGSGGFVVRDGFDQPGNDFGRVAEPDAASCQARCESNPRCRAFTFDRREERCYLKDSPGTLRPARDRVTGSREP